MIPYEGEGVATLEDGLYVLEDLLKGPDYVAGPWRRSCDRQRGWARAREHPVEAARVMLEYDPTGTPEGKAAGADAERDQ